MRIHTQLMIQPRLFFRHLQSASPNVMRVTCRASHGVQLKTWQSSAPLRTSSHRPWVRCGGRFCWASNIHLKFGEGRLSSGTYNPWPLSESHLALVFFVHRVQAWKLWIWSLVFWPSEAQLLFLWWRIASWGHLHNLFEFVLDFLSLS
jgi:hypothetical protein